MRITRSSCALVAVTLLAGCMPSCESDAEKEEAKKRSIVAVQMFDQLLHKLRAAVPPAGKLTETPCPDEALRKKVTPTTRHLCTVDSAFLDRYLAGREGGDGGAGFDDDWRWMRADAMRDLVSPRNIESPGKADVQSLAYQELLRECPYVGVLVDEERRLPTAGQGDAFSPGVWRGWLVVFDRDSLAPLCEARVAASSSAHPPVEDNPFLKGQELRVWQLEQDMRKQTEHAIRDALERITTRLGVEFTAL